MLLNIWYAFSALVGLTLVFTSVVLGSFGSLLIICGLIATIQDKDWKFLKFIGVFTGIIIIICLPTYWINVTIPKESYIVSEEIPNIQKYDGLGNEKNGKYINSYYYFEQGTNNNYSEFKVDLNITNKHYTDGQIKVIKNHKEYTSFYKNFAIMQLDDSFWYDIYVPNDK